MRGIVGDIGRKGGFVPSALALLLLFRLLIPAGYMIAPDQQGRPGLTLCAAPVRAAAPAGHGGHDGGSADPSPSQPGAGPCPYAALAAPPLPPEPPAVPSPLPAPALPLELTAGGELPRITPAAPPPPATGPPLPV
jgi:hypothetical protein